MTTTRACRFYDGPLHGQTRDLPEPLSAVYDHPQDGSVRRYCLIVWHGDPVAYYLLRPDQPKGQNAPESIMR